MDAVVILRAVVALQIQGKWRKSVPDALESDDRSNLEANAIDLSEGVVQRRPPRN
jgi:hypothetical protein